MENVVVSGAPGCRTFVGNLVPGLANLPAVDHRGPLSVVIADDGTHFGYPMVVPAGTVHELSADEQALIRNARAYRRNWSLMTGRPEREIYVPDAIRPHTVEEY